MTRLYTWIPAVLAVLLAAGCQPACPQLCAENTDYLDSCLEHWEALWPDLGYDNGQDYLDTCNTRYAAALQLAGPSESRAIRTGCAEDLSSLAQSLGCADYLPSGVELDPTEGDNGVAPGPGGG